MKKNLEQGEIDSKCKFRRDKEGRARRTQATHRRVSCGGQTFRKKKVKKRRKKKGEFNIINQLTSITIVIIQ